MVYQKKKIRLTGAPPTLQTLDSKGNPKTVENTENCRILGLQIQNDLGWRAHIGQEKPLLSSLRQKMGQIKFLGKSVPRKGKLLLINSLLISKIIYSIQIYGCMTDNHEKKIHTIMNRAARFICNASKRTNTMKLMTSCKWLSFREMVKYHSLILLWKITRLGKPDILAHKFTLDENNLLETKSPEFN